MRVRRGQTGAAARRERGRQEMVNAIVEAAEEIVASDGADALTVRGVASSLGYSPGALYEYFDSKEAILGALYFHGQGGLDAYCARIVRDLPESADTVDVITEIGRAYRDYALDHAEMYRMAFWELKSPETAAEMTAPDDESGSFGLTVETVARGIREGSIIDMPAIDIAFALWAAVHGFVMLEISGHLAGGDRVGVPFGSSESARKRRDEMFETMQQILLDGFRRKESPVADDS